MNKDTLLILVTLFFSTCQLALQAQFGTCEYNSGTPVVPATTTISAGSPFPEMAVEFLNTSTKDTPSNNIQISELRTNQSGLTETDEYIEISGPPGTLLSPYTLVVIGDGPPGQNSPSGYVEATISLSGQSIPPDGYFLVGEYATLPSSQATANLIAPLNFENNDNLTFLLVEGFNGSLNQDLDTNDDGQLETQPWTKIIDGLAIIHSTPSAFNNADKEYASLFGLPIISPQGGQAPFQVTLEKDGWKAGQKDPNWISGIETPGNLNANYLWLLTESQVQKSTNQQRIVQTIKGFGGRNTATFTAVNPGQYCIYGFSFSGKTATYKEKDYQYLSQLVGDLNDGVFCGGLTETCVTITVSTAGPCEMTGDYAGPDQEICPGQEVTLGCEYEDYCFRWKLDDVGAGNEDQSMPTISPSQSSTYSVTVTDYDGNLIKVDQVDITVREPIVPLIGGTAQVCLGEEGYLSITNAEADWTYSWSTGSSDAHIEISPEESTSYRVTVTDGLDCEGIGEITVELIDLEIIIDPDPGVLCGVGSEVILDAGENSNWTYEWSDDSDGQKLTTETVETFSVTVTDNFGCTGTDEVEVIDGNDPVVIRAFLDNKGFVCVPITISQSVSAPAPTQSENRSSNGVIDHTNLQITLEGLSLNLKQEIEDYLSALSFPLFGHITHNENFCEDNGNLIPMIESEMSGAEIGFWGHVFQSDPTAAVGELCILGATPTYEGFSPASEDQKDFILEFADLTRQGFLHTDFASTSDQIIYKMLEFIHDPYEIKLSPKLLNQEGQSQKAKNVIPCNQQSEAAICLSPAGVPVKVPEGSTLLFGRPEELKGNFDQRALVGFTDGDRSTYIAYRKSGEEYFTQYKNIWSRETTYTYTPLQKNVFYPMIFGTASVQDGEEIVAMNEIEYKVTSPDITLSGNTKGKGEHVPNFLVTGEYGTIIGGQVWSNSLPEILIDDWEEGILQVQNDPNGMDGIFFEVNDGGGVINYIYGVFTFDNPSEITFYRWNCRVGLWELFDEPLEAEKEDFNFILALLLLTQEEGHTILDIVGIIPIIGEAADAINGVWYLVEKDGKNAALSFAALIPVLGAEIVGNKYVAKYWDEVTGTLKNIKTFGKARNSLNDPTIQFIDAVSEKAVEIGLSKGQFVNFINKLMDIDSDDLYKAYAETPDLLKSWKIFEEAGSDLIDDLPALNKMLDDIGANPALVGAFAGNGGLVKAWNFVTSSPIVRRNISHIESVDLFKTSTTNDDNFLAFIKNRFDSKTSDSKKITMIEQEIAAIQEINSKKLFGQYDVTTSTNTDEVAQTLKILLQEGGNSSWAGNSLQGIEGFIFKADGIPIPNSLKTLNTGNMNSFFNKLRNNRQQIIDGSDGYYGMVNIGSGRNTILDVESTAFTKNEILNNINSNNVIDLFGAPSVYEKITITGKNGGIIQLDKDLNIL